MFFVHIMKDNGVQNKNRALLLPLYGQNTETIFFKYPQWCPFFYCKLMHLLPTAVLFKIRTFFSI